MLRLHAESGGIGIVGTINSALFDVIAIWWFVSGSVDFLQKGTKLSGQRHPSETWVVHEELWIFKGLPHDNQIHKRHPTSKCQVYQNGKTQRVDPGCSRQDHLKLRTIASRTASYWEWDARLAWWPVLGKVGGCQGWRPPVYHLSFLSIPFFHNKNCAGKYGVRTHHWCCWQPLKSWLPDRHPPDECVPVEEMGTDRLHVMDMKPEATAPSQSKVEWSKGEGTEESSFGFS